MHVPWAAAEEEEVEEEEAGVEAKACAREGGSEDMVALLEVALMVVFEAREEVGTLVGVGSCRGVLEVEEEGKDETT